MLDTTDSLIEIPGDGVAGIDRPFPAKIVTTPADNRFADPLVSRIRDMDSLYKGFEKARLKLELQAQASVRSYFGVGKEEGGKLYRRVKKAETPEDVATYEAIVAPFMEAMAPLDKRMRAVRRDMEKAAKELPVWPWCEGVRGLGAMSVARMVGQCGDFTEYRSISALWKRAGLGVINGERQRRVAGDAAILHGYSPERRAVFWNMAESLFKAQGKDDTAGPYRLYYDRQKARQLEINADTLGAESKTAPGERVCVQKHAHARAMRKMTGKVVMDMANAWCRALDKPRMAK